MGIYLNPGNETFTEITNQEIYVDKTMMLAELNKIMRRGNKYVCISRPRRFGKTVAGNMISSYYSKGCDSRAIFSRLKISGAESFEADLNAFNVIKIDLNSEYRNCRKVETVLHSLTDKIIEEFQEQFPELNINENYSIGEAIMKVYAKKHEQFVILIDEYDVLVRESVSGNVPDALFNEYLGFLNGLFKSDTLRPAIALAYLTGILPIVRDKVQSKLNNFREYTMEDASELNEYVGFTEEEVKSLCGTYGIDFDECRQWYDGYRLGQFDIYNPESVVMSILERNFSSYWGRTSTYRVISDRLEQNFEGTRDDVVAMLAGESVEVNVTRYMNTMDSFYTRSDVFTYLIHLGYLAYSRKDQTCRIPNREVRQEWFNAIETESDYKITNKIIQSSKNLLSETLAGNERLVAESLDMSHIHVTSNRSYNNEDALQSAIYLSFIYALNKYYVFKELTTGKGFADVVFVPFKKSPETPALIVELKRNKCADSAINQIKEKKYFSELAPYTGKIIFVGISYDEETKTHACKIEWFEK
ncbi:MAG: AAA family ATPase [Treponema sp.]|nr:AAA family ATPase [Treponema sp.]